MNPDFRILQPKKLIGQKMTMSLVENLTFQLWSGFMPRRKEIRSLSADLFSIQVFNASFDFKNFNPAATFEKWATVEVEDFNMIPAGMEKFELEGGLYAVFLHKGAASTGPQTFQYIFGTWLPNSDFLLDHRPHFELLGEKYKNEDPDSEEEIWIPVKRK